MKIALCQTAGMRNRCFAPRDLQRLSKHQIVLASTDSESEIVAEWPSLVAGAEVLITGWGSPPLTEEMLDQAGDLRLIVHAAGSIRHLIPRSVFARGIRVCTNNGTLAAGVAETTLGMIISGLKGFDRCAQLTRGGGWKTGPMETPGFMVRELFDVTIGLIGLSQVGRRVATLLQPFEVQVLAYDPYATAADQESLNVRLVDLPDLLRASEVVSLHAPALPETRHMLGRREFSLMQDGAIFINTARGSIVDESALIDELATGRISAIIDVTDPEPPAVDHPFRRLPNVVLTPHISGAISNGCLRLGKNAVNQILDFVAERPLAGEVTEEAMQIMA